MTEEFKILTQRKKGEAHRETKVQLSWDGITERELKVMAKGLICYILQCQFKKSNQPIPAELSINAKDMVHMEPQGSGRKFKLPRHDMDWMDKLLADMSDADKQVFLESIE